MYLAVSRLPATDPEQRATADSTQMQMRSLHRLERLSSGHPAFLWQILRDGSVPADALWYSAPPPAPRQKCLACEDAQRRFSAPNAFLSHSFFAAERR